MSISGACSSTLLIWTTKDEEVQATSQSYRHSTIKQQTPTWTNGGGSVNEVLVSNTSTMHSVPPPRHTSTHQSDRTILQSSLMFRLMSVRDVAA
jgi:hypothetical protein